MNRQCGCGLAAPLVTAIVVAAMSTRVAPAQNFKVLVNFGGTDGAGPTAGLVQGLDGSFYGTTESGGANLYYGTVFKVTQAADLTTLYSFCAETNCSDGSSPYAGLTQASNGNLYGTTAYGGANSNYGTVFKITPTGRLTTLYSFCSQSECADGYNPFTSLVQATDGDLYGTIPFGGVYGGGTLFKITPTGTLTTLYSFCAQTHCTDGSDPRGNLVQATDGNFYGTTELGGADTSDCDGYGFGTVFRITPAGTLTTLHSFSFTDGAYPEGGLVQGNDGNFYGITYEGGMRGYGTIFKITPTGALTTLYSFCAQTNCIDGYYPSAGLVQATDGNFYGTTLIGGSADNGTVFRMTPRGDLTTLHDFVGNDGSGPEAVLVQATSGVLYGTAASGGMSSACTVKGGCGTIFSLSVGLGPFVETTPTSGKIGAAVKILGNNLTGATSVSFNGVAATFTVVSLTEISTTVPSGATRGTVEVTTPKGTLSSNTLFVVKP
jgi:uncharacterized repeat protein (TIGR03803 family)